LDDRIDFAMRRFRQIVPEPIRDRHEMPVRELGVWLRDDVAPLVGEYVGRRAFQNAALWSLRAFRTGFNSPERQQVDTVARSLVAVARLLKMALNSKRVWAALGKSLPPMRLVDEEVTVGGVRPEITRRTAREVDPQLFLRAQIESIARPFWRDLVDSADYLEPVCGWLYREVVSDRVTAGEFVVAMNPELHAIGDFVTRSMFRRIDTLAGILVSANRDVRAACRTLKGALPKCFEKLPERLTEMQKGIKDLHAICQPDGQWAIRDSCVILAQAYVAFHQAPDLAWLGLDEAIIANGKATLRRRFVSGDREYPERIAAALDLKRLYANEPPGRSELEEALVGERLVLVPNASPPLVYWAGELVDVEWDKHYRCWELLLALARKAQCAAVVEERDLFDTSASISSMPNLASRLKSLLPATFRGRIVPGKPIPRSYRLDLAAEQITVIRGSI